MCGGDGVCMNVCVDSSKCHGISHGNASQHPMSAPLFPKLSGEKLACTCTRAHLHTLRDIDGKGYVDNCQDDKKRCYYLFYESLVVLQSAAKPSFDMCLLNQIETDVC